jgi:hypothetical protein
MNGGQGRNRTSDTRIFSAVLYQLSYLALSRKASASARATADNLRPACRPPQFHADPDVSED